LFILSLLFIDVVFIHFSFLIFIKTKIYSLQTNDGYTHRKTKPGSFVNVDIKRLQGMYQVSAQ